MENSKKTKSEESFFKIPYEMFTHHKLKCLNSNGIMLYGMMSNFSGWSKQPKNRKKYTDEHGRVFIIFTEMEAAKRMNITKGTFFKLKKQLKNLGLIDYSHQKEKKQGVSTPIYVTPFEVWKTIN